MIRICMLVPDFDRTGGYERQAFALSRDLRSRGHEVFILTNKTRPGLAGFETREGVAIHRILPTPARRSPAYRFRIVLVLLSFFVRYGRHFDILHSHALTHVTILAMLTGNLFGKKSLIKIATGGDLSKLVNSPRTSHRLLIRLLKHSDTCISLSGDIDGELLSAGVPREKIFRTLNGVDTELFTPVDAETRERKKSELGLPAGRIVTFVGRFEFRKGADLLLEAWKRVMATRTDAHCILIGFGEEDARLRSLAAKLGIGESVSFPGEITNVVDYLQASDIFVIPSRREGNPNTLLEASACGLPIVGTMIGGIVEAVTDGENGLLVPPDDGEALAGRVLSLLGDEALAVRLGSNARKAALGRFSFDVIGAAYLSRYREILSRQPAT